MIRTLNNFLDSSAFRKIELFQVILVIMAIFLYPANYGPTRLENYILPLIILILSFKRPVFDRTLVILLVANLLIGLISVYINLHYSYGLMELIRWIKYIFVLVYFSSLEPEILRKFGLAMRISFIGMIVLNLLQIFNPLNLGVELASIYSHHPLYMGNADELDKSFRLLGTAINPNNNAVLWLLMSIYFLVEYYEKRKLNSLFYVFVAFLFIIFTQSRTAVVVFIFIGFLNLMLYRFNLRNILFILLMLVTGGFIAISLKFTYLWHIFLFNPLKIHSLQLRFAIWRDMLQLMYEKPLIGWGNLKNYQTLYPKVPDNEFLYILLNQGMLGLLGVLLIFIYTTWYFMKDRRTYVYSYLPVFLVTCSLIIGITNLAFTNVRVGMYFFMIWGFAAAFRYHGIKKPAVHNHQGQDSNSSLTTSEE